MIKTRKSVISEVLIYEILTLGNNKSWIASKKMVETIMTNPTCDIDIPSPSDKIEINVFAICAIKYILNLFSRYSFGTQMLRLGFPNSINDVIYVKH